MSSKKILFRADSSSKIGLGHIMRDLVLAKQFENDEVLFAVQDLKGNINHKIKDAGYKVEILKDNSFDELQRLIDSYKLDMIVIDNYDIDYDFEKKLKMKNPKLKLMVLDDTYKRHYCDILLNHNIGADESRYKDLVPKNCELRCGREFMLIRDEFKNIRQRDRTIKCQDRFHILIAMGGSDPQNFNIKILKLIANNEIYFLNIITTSSNKNLQELKEYATNKKNINIHVDTNEVAHIMHNADLAIITPSVIINEVFFMRLPFIAIKVIDNQEDIYSFLKSKNMLVLEKENFNNLTNYLQMIIKNENYQEVYRLIKALLN